MNEGKLEIVKGWRDLHASNFPTPEGLWVTDKKPVREAILSYSALRNMYRRCSFVRPCVDAIVRTISGCRWAIVGRGMREDIGKLTRLFSIPNRNKTSFQLFIRQVLLDLVVLDEAYIEKVRSPVGEIVELNPLDASLVNPILDEEGVIEKFEYNSKKGIIELPARDVIFMRLYPRTNTIFGTSIIETILNEVVALMFSVKSIADAFEEDEIPPGILHLGKIGQEAYMRAKEAFRASRGERGKRQLAVVDNVDIVKWVDFSRPFREMQLAELIERVERIVYKNFGIFTMEMQNLRGLPIGTAREMHKITYSQLIRPIMKLMEDVFNREIVDEFDPRLKFEWVLEPVEDPETKARTLAVLVDRGIITKNEAREMLGFEPVPEGEGLIPRPAGRPPKLDTLALEDEEFDLERQLKPEKWDGRAYKSRIESMISDLKEKLTKIYSDYESRISRAIYEKKPLKFIEEIIMKLEDAYERTFKEAARRQAALARRMVTDAQGFDRAGGTWLTARQRELYEKALDQRARMIPDLMRKSELAYANRDVRILLQEFGRVRRFWVDSASSAIGNAIWKVIQPFLEATKKKYRWVAIIDERTCSQCRMLNGEEFIPTEDHIYPKDPSLPCNGNCRCWLDEV